MRQLLTGLMVVLIAASGGRLHAAEYEIAIQPILPQYQIQQAYQPMADYLGRKTGHSFVIKTYRNFLTYWERMKKQRGFDFVLDAAHFTDWRVKRQDFIVLTRLPDTVSFSLVTGEDSFVFEAEELILKKIATMPSPGMGAIRLNDMFPNPVRLPFYIQSKDSNDAARKVVAGEVEAAIIPTRLVSSYAGLNMVDTTEPVPHMAFSASPRVPEAVRQQVRQALLEAPKTEDGRQMLEQVNIGTFQLADNSDYDGYAELLQAVFGY